MKSLKISNILDPRTIEKMINVCYNLSRTLVLIYLPIWYYAILLIFVKLIQAFIVLFLIF